MKLQTTNKASTLQVAIAFALVFIVWGSTYFFISIALKGFPPMVLGAIRFLSAGALLFVWCMFKGDKLWVKKDVITAIISGLLTLFIAMSIVFYVEMTLPSAIVAIMVSTNPIWIIMMDKPNWKNNLKNKSTIYGLIVGFLGILLLFGESFIQSMENHMNRSTIFGLILLLFSPIAWSAGSLYSKKNTSRSPIRVTTAWQMMVAGIAFLPVALLRKEFTALHLDSVPTQSWMAIVYLIIFGSIVAFSAYIWLLQVRPATQVSTHSYVNPVVAVLLGVSFGHEHISTLQLVGLAIILTSVLLVNLHKYNFWYFKKADRGNLPTMVVKPVGNVCCENQE